MQKLTGLDEKSIIASFVSGESIASIGRKHGISRQWASKIVNDFRRQKPNIGDNNAELDTVNYRARLKKKAIDALECGLDSKIEDPLRAGALGLGALKEMGALAEEGNADKAIRLLIDQLANLPPDVRADYICLDESSVKVIPKESEPAHKELNRHDKK